MANAWLQHVAPQKMSEKWLLEGASCCLQGRRVPRLGIGGKVTRGRNRREKKEEYTPKRKKD
jgi:hypothetical protein